MVFRSAQRRYRYMSGALAGLRDQTNGASQTAQDTVLRIFISLNDNLMSRLVFLIGEKSHIRCHVSKHVKSL